jgi:hypothetical protein
MYENELQNKKDVTDYFEKKLLALLQDKDMLVKKYEQRIKALSISTLPSSADSSTSLAMRITPQEESVVPQPIPPRKFPPSPKRLNQVKVSSKRALSERPTP